MLERTTERIKRKGTPLVIGFKVQIVIRQKEKKNVFIHKFCNTIENTNLKYIRLSSQY